MSRVTWSAIKQTKRFYVNTFRWVGSLLLVSIAINLGLGLVTYYVYFNQPEPDFYATYGETPPVLLTSMDAPNYTSVPLLANDLENDSNIKAIPK